MPRRPVDDAVRHAACDLAHASVRRAPPRLCAVLLPVLAAALLAATAARAEIPPAGAPGGLWAGYEVVEVSYLLRAPDGSLVRVSRRPPAEARAWLPGTPPAGGAVPGEARVQPVFGLQGWLSGWLFRTPRIYEELSDYVRESWAVILRLLDYLGVVLLITGSWVIWFLVRPVLLGLSDRTAFLLVFALVCGLWAYATQLYASIAYALGLMLLPALVLSLLGWLGRRAWMALRGAG